MGEGGPGQDLVGLFERGEVWVDPGGRKGSCEMASLWCRVGECNGVWGSLGS